MNVSSRIGSESGRLSLASALRDCLACGVVIVDAKGKVRAFSGGAELLTGIPAAQVLNREIKVLPSPLRRVLKSVCDNGTAVEDKRLVLSGTNGVKITVRVAATPLRSGAAGTGAALVLNDVTPAETFEENVRRLDRLASLGTLSTGTAHEIKNALVAVKTFIDLLLEKNQDAELAEVVQREMSRISSLVTQTLKFAGPARPNLSDIRLHELLDHSLRMVKPQMDKKIIAVHRKFNASSDAIRGDDYQLEQVFVNLFLNAVEAMGESGSLTIATEILEMPSPQGKRPHVRMTIADTGVGIASENLGRIFEPFFTTKDNGTGLGLVIARRIVEEHGGNITLQSEVNKGTSFSLLLPVQSDAR